MKNKEGIIKFTQKFNKEPALEPESISRLNLWRDILYQEKLIGQDQQRYKGAGYGNISQRLKPYDLPINKRRFIITGSQTGHLPKLTEAEYTTVLEYYPEQNLVVSKGPIKASSESMTHGAIYNLDSSIVSVFHAHSPDIWKHSKKLKLPTTKETIEYGTPEMAEEVKRLYRDTNLRDLRIFSMGGHEDGIITFGKTLEETGSLMLEYLSKSTQFSNR